MSIRDSIKLQQEYINNLPEYGFDFIKFKATVFFFIIGSLISYFISGWLMVSVLVISGFLMYSCVDWSGYIGDE